MLQIIANNINLNLPEDIQITLIIENPFMVNDRIPTPYTLSFDLPATKINLKATKWPNRITSYQQAVELPCEIVFDSITFARGLLSVDGFDDHIKVSFKSISAFDNLRQKLFEVEMKKYEFGTVKRQINSPDVPRSQRRKWEVDRDDPTNFAGIYRNVSNSSLTDQHFVLAPVKIANTQWRTVTKVTIEGRNTKVFKTLERADLSADELYLNFWNNQSQEFNIITENTRAFPFPYLHYVFDQVFNNTLINNPFSEGELKSLVVVNSYHPKYYKYPSYIINEDLRGMIFDNYEGQNEAFVAYNKLNSFMPDVFANEFLKDILKIFCMSLIPLGDRFKIVKNKDMINSSEVENWNRLLIDKLSTQTRVKTSYKYGYSAIKEDFLEVMEENKVNTIAEMYALSLSEDYGYTTNFYIKSTGEYFTKTSDETGATYKRNATGYGNVTEGSDNVYDTVSNISPLPMTVDGFWTAMDPTDEKRPPISQWYVPEFSGDRMTRGTTASIMFYRGKNPTFNGAQYPLLTATNKNANGTTVGELSLAWDGENGLINKFHKEFKLWVEKDKVMAYGDFKLSAKELKMLDFSKKKHINGRNFYFEKLQVVIRKNRIEPAQIDLIEV